MTQQTYLSRKRTLDEAYNELKQLDPNTAFSKYYIRRLAISGAVPTIMCGRKRLIDLDALIEYLNEPHDIEFTASNSAAEPLAASAAGSTHTTFKENRSTSPVNGNTICKGIRRVI